MTSTRSALATALPSRRNLIAQAGMLASIGAAGTLMAVPACADEPGPIERMYAEHVPLADAVSAATEARFDAEGRYVEPLRPLWHPTQSAGGYLLEKLPEQQCLCYLDDRDKNVAKLKAMIATPFVDDPSIVMTEAMHQARVDRAKDTLAQIEAWQAEASRRADAAGLPKALEVEDRAKAAAEEHAVAALAIEPSSFREAAFKGAVLQLTGWDDVQVLDLLMRLADLAGIDPYLDA